MAENSSLLEAEAETQENLTATLSIKSLASQELSKVNSNKMPMMTEEIEERNQLAAYFADKWKNQEIARSITQIFGLSINHHLKSSGQGAEKKEIFDALVLQMLKSILPGNLKHFITDPKLIESLVRKISEKYQLDLLEVVIKVADFQQYKELQELI